MELAIKLAHAKAAAVSQANPDAIVIGADQLATIDGLILGKPGSPENAVQQLLKLAGRTHLLVTAMHVISPDGRNQQVLDQSQLTMRRLSKEALDRYVALDRPIDCAGSYKLEAAGIALFEQIQTQDHTAITGLPLLSLVRILEGLNYPVP